MNSYELDQPLDLRLKALNLSRFHHNHNHHHHPEPPNIYQAAFASSQYNYTQQQQQLSVGLNNTNTTTTTASGGFSHQPSSDPLAGGFYSRPAGSDGDPSAGSQILNPPFVHHHRYQSHSHQHHLHSHGPSLPAGPGGFQQPSHGSPPAAAQTAPASPAAAAAPLSQQQHQGHGNLQHQTALTRSATTVHCQPLNHHQPHPLSRLHPPPSHLQQRAQSQSAQQTEVAQTTAEQHYSQLQAARSPGHQSGGSPPAANPGGRNPLVAQNYSQNHLSASAASVAASAAAAVAAAARQSSLSSPDHRLSPYNHHFQHHHAGQLMPPVRSLSLSSQMMSPSQLTRAVPQTLTPPGGSLQLGANFPSAACSEQQVAGAREQFAKFGQSTSSMRMVSPTAANLAGPVAATTAAPKTTASPATSSPTGGNTSANSTSGSASPITRQNSLVSRYNCKPCGIVFSQPETLRAHQEGYCTKRDRSQAAQMRSQSAVSPAVIKQTVAANSK